MGRFCCRIPVQIAPGKSPFRFCPAHIFPNFVNDSQNFGFLFRRWFASGKATSLGYRSSITRTVQHANENNFRF